MILSSNVDGSRSDCRHTGLALYGSLTVRLAFGITFALFAAASDTGSQNPATRPVPKVHDPGLVLELVAAEPDIVHPIACDCDARGRLLVIESHTHFAPKDYAGP